MGCSSSKVDDETRSSRKATRTLLETNTNNNNNNNNQNRQIAQRANLHQTNAQNNRLTNSVRRVETTQPPTQTIQQTEIYLQSKNNPNFNYEEVGNLNLPQKTFLSGRG
jgi:hypothetical protein